MVLHWLRKGAKTAYCGLSTPFPYSVGFYSRDLFLKAFWGHYDLTNVRCKDCLVLAALES